MIGAEPPAAEGEGAISLERPVVVEDSSDSETMRIGGCRLCAGRLTHQFDVRLLDKYDVSFLLCDACGSLQTEQPYWLDEAYAESNLSHLDTGAAQRNLSNLGATYGTCMILGVRRVYDVGGGDGLLCRLLRDYDVDCYISDRYARNAYAQGFEHNEKESGGLVTAFEVVEHYANPREDLGELLERDADAVLISTGIYTGQGADWWYLTPKSGQHVFFYSRKALGIAGDIHGYDVGFSGNFVLFTRRGRFTRWRCKIAEFMLKPLMVRVSRALLLAMPARGSGRDLAIFG